MQLYNVFASGTEYTWVDEDYLEELGDQGGGDLDTGSSILMPRQVEMPPSVMIIMFFCSVENLVNEKMLKCSFTNNAIFSCISLNWHSSDRALIVCIYFYLQDIYFLPEKPRKYPAARERTRGK